MSTRTRIVLALLAVLVLGGAAVGYVWNASAHGDGAAGTVDLRASGTVLVRSTADGPGYGHLATARPGSAPVPGPQQCARVFAAQGKGICLGPSTQALGGYEIAALDQTGTPTRTIPLNGVPSRARVSPSGRMLSWTVFVTGDSYNGGQFATRSGILDTGTNTLAGTLESFAVTLDGKPYSSVDVNFWGVTFTGDDNRFYATMSTHGRRYLVQGDFAAKTFRTLRENVECPSLSPDGTRLAFKKRVSDDPGRTWRFSVLELATMRETPLAETRSVDDQAVWLDGRTIGYGLPRDDRHADVWAVPADGSGVPRVLVADAESPAPIP